MKNCPKCQVSVSDTAKFCVKCGFNIKKFEEENAARECFCPECGTKFSGGTFCPECGYDVSGDLAGTESGEEAVATVTVPRFDFIAGVDFGAMNTEAQTQFYEKEGFIEENGVLTGYTGKKRIITIPGAIDEIYDEAFAGNEIICHAKIEEGVKLIGKRAFADCPALVKLYIPASVQQIFPDAFEGTQLETLVLPASDISLIKQVLSNVARIFFDFAMIDRYITQENGTVVVDVKGINKAADEQFNEGETVKFGAYYQTDDETKEPVEWIVLKRNENYALLLSKHVLDRQQMNEKHWDQTACWEISTLRMWLYESFLDRAFSRSERAYITGYTGSYLFPLYKTEVEKYFSCLDAAQAKPTAYAIKRGAAQDESGYTNWWLRDTIARRSLGFYDDGMNACYFCFNGRFESTVAHCNGIGVRPAMWINLDFKE